MCVQILGDRLPHALHSPRSASQYDEIPNAFLPATTAPSTAVYTQAKKRPEASRQGAVYALAQTSPDPSSHYAHYELASSDNPFTQTSLDAPDKGGPGGRHFELATLSDTSALTKGGPAGSTTNSSGTNPVISSPVYQLAAGAQQALAAPSSALWPDIEDRAVTLMPGLLLLLV